MRLRTADEVVELDALVAESPEARATGLMHVRSMPEDDGMVFLFDGETQGAFYMKNTLIPLSIAFWDADGRIVDVLDMQPCERDPCELHAPSDPYVGALEVNQGFFERHGIDEGDVVTIDR